MQKGAWKYDVLEAGYKCNMTDIQAAIGLIELERYQENMDRRATIFGLYYNGFKDCSWAMLPIEKDEDRSTCYHLFQLCIDTITEEQRDAIIHEIFEKDGYNNEHTDPAQCICLSIDLDGVL